MNSQYPSGQSSAAVRPGWRGRATGRLEEPTGSRQGGAAGGRRARRSSSFSWVWRLWAGGGADGRLCAPGCSRGCVGGRAQGGGALRAPPAETRGGAPPGGTRGGAPPSGTMGGALR